ncbi:hypothetical protein [Aquabacterium sp. OR-4]|uniref:hypothetical protein n=1 Tax=Aquabacterium sp. OR-4 TaxID=2978127 RepID=UPI0021B3FC73|nr:hypothetical protein [Aquabacterium sp. OR-4]MDT7833942.1 hypothetical protein [Aquabacterium sp. OR-4]
MSGLLPSAPRTHASALHRAVGALLGALTLLPASTPAQAANEGAGPGIYTCVDAQGKRITSDRPIAACLAREQQVRNRDGSLRQVIPPSLTPEERAEREAIERRAALQRAAQTDAVRRDRNLMSRFPNESAHLKARNAALDTVQVAIRTTEQRLKDLAAERKPLVDETEFYKGRPLPLKLKQQLDANDAAMQAQREATKTQAAELARIHALYDGELERLRALWAGSSPGSLPVVNTSSDPSRGVRR